MHVVNNLKYFVLVLVSPRVFLDLYIRALLILLCRHVFCMSYFIYTIFSPLLLWTILLLPFMLFYSCHNNWETFHFVLSKLLRAAVASFKSVQISRTRTGVTVQRATLLTGDGQLNLVVTTVVKNRKIRICHRFTSICLFIYFY